MTGWAAYSIEVTITIALSLQLHKNR